MGKSFLFPLFSDRFSVLATAVGALVLLHAVPVRAQVMAEGDPFVVNSYTTGSQAHASVAMDRDGDFVIAWDSGYLGLSSQDGSSAGVFVQRYDAAGTPIGTEFQANEYTTSLQGYPHISVHPSEDYFSVVWQSNGQDGDDAGVFGATFDFPTGLSSLGEFQINEVTTGIQNGGVALVIPTSGGSGSKQQYPGLDLRGGGFAAFLESDSDSLTDLVMLFMLGAEAGNPDQTVEPASATTPAGAQYFVVNTYTTDYQGRGDACADADGNFIVTWTSFGQEGDGPGVYGQRFNNDGTRSGTEFHVNTYTTGYQLNSEVCCGHDGNFVVVWNSTDFSGSGQDGDVGGIFGQRFGADGMPAGTEFQVNEFTTGDQNGGVLACDAQGNFVVSWSSVTVPGGVVGRAFASDAIPAGGEFVVADNADSNPVQPSVGMSNDGRFVVAWHTYASDGSHNGVNARRYSLTGIGASTTTTTVGPTTTTTTLPSGLACGDPIVDAGQGGSAPAVVTASDALFVLQAGVGISSCELCICDVNDSGAITATDALTVLNSAVGFMVELVCPPCLP